MRSSKSKLKKNNKELVLEITIGEKDSELFERLNNLITTHKLPNKKNNPN
jgi:hypothetical protein